MPRTIVLTPNNFQHDRSAQPTDRSQLKRRPRPIVLHSPPIVPSSQEDPDLSFCTANDGSCSFSPSQNDRLGQFGGKEQAQDFPSQRRNDLTIKEGLNLEGGVSHSQQPKSLVKDWKN